MRFYGDGEIFTHMQREHFECHICKRARPDVYTYYSDYPELHKHFTSEHYCCEHPACLAKKFIVFPSPTVSRGVYSSSICAFPKFLVRAA